jgi:putative transcriptional regulator
MAAERHVGKLLVAAPGMTDPRFEKTVVLLLDHDADGALGVVLNRPTSVGVAEVLPGWNAVVSAPDVVFDGGPVATDSALGVAQVAGSEEPVGFRTMFGGADEDAFGPMIGRRTGLVDLDTPIELMTGALASLRVFAGYAGWAPGQLEDEIGTGGWFVLEARAEDISAPAPANLWRVVLRRQTGDLALMSTYPRNPALN